MAVRRKPSRSDEALNPDEQDQITAAVRDHFEASAPKRFPKPPRSEPGHSWHVKQEHMLPPEQERLRQLLSESQRLPIEGGIVNSDEYPENEYYKGLNSVVTNGQHYTTGSGFIAMENHVNGMLLDLDSKINTHDKPCYKSNPATNDWEPTPEMVFPKSRKPSRSDP